MLGFFLMTSPARPAPDVSPSFVSDQQLCGRRVAFGSGGVDFIISAAKRDLCGAWLMSAMGRKPNVRFALSRPHFRPFNQGAKELFFRFTKSFSRGIVQVLPDTSLQRIVATSLRRWPVKANIRNISPQGDGS